VEEKRLGRRVEEEVGKPRIWKRNWLGLRVEEVRPQILKRRLGLTLGRGEKRSGRVEEEPG
jgi:hypothetical protein